MIAPQKIRSQHLERLALVYIRQSSLAQVRENTESTARQYALASEAARLGWPSSQIVIIDADLGLSGRSGSERTGFKELVSRVCVGEVGAILGLEVSRLARSSAEFQLLLEFCSITDTLIVDADGVYDLRQFNDRLLLGLKGTMSEAELHILAGRLQESKRAAARRGALRFPLAVGYVYNEERQTVMDLDEQVRAAVADVFSAFDKAGSAYGVVGAFAQRLFPRRAYGGAWSGEIRWGRLTHGRVISLLSNPSYTGAYVYGRFRSQRYVDGEGRIRTRTVELPRQEWAVILHGHHPAYISWETFLANEERLTRNCTRSGARPPREGSALLQGIARCGGCGRTMTVCYSSSGKGAYECSRSRQDHTQTVRCRSVVAELVDRAVAARLLAAVTPEQIALALAAADEVTVRWARSTRALELQVERTRYEAARAERAFHHCEPENRLVARSLERRWEEKLGALAEAEAALATAQATVAPLPARAELEALARDIPQLWEASTTLSKDRKRMVRSLVSDVTLISEPAGEQVRVGIRWRSGATEEVKVMRPGVGRRTPPRVVEWVRCRWERSDKELATELNAAGFVSGGGQPFKPASVAWVRWAYKIPHEPKPALLGSGEATVAEVAGRVGVSEGVVYRWIRNEELQARRARTGQLCVRFSSEIEEVCRQQVARSTRLKSRNALHSVGGAV